MNVTDALDAVEQRIQAFPPAVLTEDPRTVLSRLRALGDPGTRNYEATVTRAALAVVLAAAIDRAETADFASGEAA